MKFPLLCGGFALAAIAILSQGDVTILGQDRTAASVETQRALVNEYCVKCHNDKLKSGGFSWTDLDIAHPDANAQQACLVDIPRTQDEASAINQETFQCVSKHFICDPATGRATRDSAQQQLDCLNDLESTQQARNETPAAAK